MIRILQGHAAARLRDLPDNSVQACVTSPPYFQMRDYATAIWVGGDPACDHKNPTRHQMVGSTGIHGRPGHAEARRNETFRSQCGLCGADRVDEQIGQENTPEGFIEALMTVFREVKRVLRPDGVCFVNLGDSFCGTARAAGDDGFVRAPDQGGAFTGTKLRNNQGATSNMAFEGVRPKSLLLIPERFVLAMQADGWIVRCRIAWCKKTTMPESVRDRPTSAWEHIWMFTKEPKYYWDAEAVRQPGGAGGSANLRNYWMLNDPAAAQWLDFWQFATEHLGQEVMADLVASYSARLDELPPSEYWLLGPAPSSLEHYAGFPPELPRRCIRAATSEKGACPACMKPWRRIVAKVEDPEHIKTFTNYRPGWTQTYETAKSRGDAVHRPISAAFAEAMKTRRETVAWAPDCTCDAGEPVPCVVLDPFLGSGTTLLVADRLDRDGYGIDLSETYVSMAERRLRSDAPLFADDLEADFAGMEIAPPPPKPMTLGMFDEPEAAAGLVGE